mmetsp:Transcript_9266/g.19537  ORF Transcript_9266/g.19537 Transcript_9266/m.19537 type:complete len:284 (+) Transcript_9266:215-1066(+)
MLRNLAISKFCFILLELLQAILPTDTISFPPHKIQFVKFGLSRPPNFLIVRTLLPLYPLLPIRRQLLRPPGALPRRRPHVHLGPADLRVQISLSVTPPMQQSFFIGWVAVTVLSVVFNEHIVPFHPQVVSERSRIGLDILPREIQAIQRLDSFGRKLGGGCKDGRFDITLLGRGLIIHRHFSLLVLDHHPTMATHFLNPVSQLDLSPVLPAAARAAAVGGSSFFSSHFDTVSLGYVAAASIACTVQRELEEHFTPGEMFFLLFRGRKIGFFFLLLLFSFFSCR